MDNNKKGIKKPLRKPIIREENGLTIMYDKINLDKEFPHLVTEIMGKMKSVKIDSIESDLETRQLDSKKYHPRELVNPGAIDFIRRCSTKKEALSILDYLVKRKEINDSDYISYKNQILKERGLKEFIDKHGGFKKPGYYEKKYRGAMREKKIKK
ncbi:MAG: DUF2095 family protein [Promethearchaeota archaeon]